MLHKNTTKKKQKLDIEGEHTTPFPEEIIILPIFQTSKEFELVLDSFMGSGTTVRVCDKLGRSFEGNDSINKRIIELFKISVFYFIFKNIVINFFI